MNNQLPDPKKFKDHKMSYVSTAAKVSEKSYDLKKIHENFMKAKEVQREKFLQPIPDSELSGEINPSKLLYELIDLDFLRSCNNWKWFQEIVGYSDRDKSLTIHLKDRSGEIQTVAIRSSIDRDGNPVKWKTLGLKKYIPYEIRDDFIFLFSGMAELLIMKALGLSYIMLQSDGMVKHLSLGLKSLTKEKVIVVLQDNDESFKKIVPVINSFFEDAEVIVIDFEKLMGHPLKKGYDFRDFCNEIKDANKVVGLIEEEIILTQEKNYAEKCYKE